MKKIILLSVLAFNVFSCKDKEEPKPAVEEIIKKELVQTKVADDKLLKEDAEVKADKNTVDVTSPVTPKKPGNTVVKNSPVVTTQKGNGVSNTGSTKSGSTTIVKVNPTKPTPSTTNTNGAVSSTGISNFTNTSNSSNSSSTPNQPKVETKIIKSSSNKELTVITDKHLGSGIADMYFNLDTKVKADQVKMDAKNQQYAALSAEKLKYNKLASDFLSKSEAADKKVTELYNQSKAKYNEINSLTWDASKNAPGFDWTNFHPTKTRLEKEKEDLDNQRMPFLAQAREFDKKYRHNESLATDASIKMSTLGIELNNEGLNHQADIDRLNKMIKAYGIVVK
ncbi:hypothetical protein EI427_17890 [Flammeovirga pectinis]|uniref:Uncharacterized protein n=1 Tax=Flammeovirga pectinis TaxID=2494373 RepID=A0A3Q9FQF7_9BACT|nr:hypothetical protein [Flammeovirga pectinis]AZQ64030.1 hypothetical protein EI427_17890 [Flammeovirga pectinis]